MPASIIGTIIVGCAFGYIALKLILFLFDRPMTPKQRQRWNDEIDAKQEAWLNSPEFQKLNQERLSRLQHAQQPEHKGCSLPYSAK